jgi:hypothetical protein
MRSTALRQHQPRKSHLRPPHEAVTAPAANLGRASGEKGPKARSPAACAEFQCRGDKHSAREVASLSHGAGTGYQDTAARATAGGD